MNTGILRARQTKFIAYIFVYALVVATIVIVANVLADRHNKTYDTTSNKRYSLSEQTAKIVKGLTQPATITYFQQATRFNQAKDELDQYAALSPKVHVEYVDPEKSPELARAANIKEFGTALVQIGDRKEQAKSVTEEGITGALIRDLKQNVRTICFVEGSGEHGIDDTQRDGYSQFKDSLAPDGYQTKSVNLVTKADIPAECTVVVIGGPISDYQQPEVDAIKIYVQNGGRAMIMVDPPLKMGREQIGDNDAFDAALQGWGVTPSKDLVLDFNPIGQLAGLGPQMPLVTTYDSQPIVADMTRRATTFPIVRSLDTKNGEKTTVERMFGSSNDSVATSKLNSPNINPSDPQNAKGPFTLAAAGTYNTGKENSQGRFVVVGSSSWVTNGFLRFNANRDLALNTINWLASDEDLISIRPKSPDDRRITMTQSQVTWLRITSLFVLPLLVVAGGVTVWWRRR